MSTELLGEIVTWDFTSSELPLSAIRQALSDAGLDPDEARDLHARAAFSRASKHLKENRSIDKVTQAAGSITFQLTKKEIEHGRVDFDYECKVTLDTDTGHITCDESREIQTRARELFARAMQVRSSGDITRLVQRLFKNNADLFPLNQKGVAYFTPHECVEFVEKVDRFIVAMGGKMGRFPVPKGTTQGNQSVMDAVTTGMESLITEMDEAVKEWNSDTRRSTVARAAQRFKIMKTKADAYAQYLGAKQDEIAKKLRASAEALVARSTELGISKKGNE